MSEGRQLGMRDMRVSDRAAADRCDHVSGGEDGKIKIWLVDEQKLVAALCLRAGRDLTKDEWARYIGLDTPRQPSCRGRPPNWRTPHR